MSTTYEKITLFVYKDEEFIDSAWEMQSSATFKELLSGLVVMSLVVVIWASNLVATRYSILNGFSSFDLVALRYLVAGLLTLPHFFCLGVRDMGGLGWRRGAILGCLAGSPYMLVFFSALGFAPAAHAAVLNPGIVPSVVFLGMVFMGKQSFRPVAVFSLVSIVFGLILVTSSSFLLKGDVLFGDVLCFISGISWGLFTLLTKTWKVAPMQCATVISIVSLVWIPPYMLFFYDGLSVSLTHLLLQGGFQGIINSILMFYMLIYSIRRLGAQLTSLFSPLVPIMATLLAVPFLGEVPTLTQWIGVVVVGLGILGVARSI